MDREENNHYSGKVEKYENGKVLFRLDYKIGEFRRSQRGMKRSILINDDDFYVISGIDIHSGEKINVGNKYKVDRKELHNIIKERLKERKKEGKTKSIDDDINLDGIDIKGDITGTGIANLLMEEDDRERNEDEDKN